MQYPKAIFLMSGEVITLTGQEAKQIQEQLIGGAEWISVQGELINAKSVSKVGNHHATVMMKNIEGVQEKTNLKIAGSETKKLPEPDFYIDEQTGEKHYS